MSIAWLTPLECQANLAAEISPLDSFDSQSTVLSMKCHLTSGLGVRIMDKKARPGRLALGSEAQIRGQAAKEGSATETSSCAANGAQPHVLPSSLQ